MTRPAVALLPDPGQKTARVLFHVLIGGEPAAVLALQPPNTYTRPSGAPGWRTDDPLPDAARDRLVDCLMIVGGDLTAALDLFATVGVEPDHTFEMSVPSRLRSLKTDPSSSGDDANWRGLPLLTHYYRPATAATPEPGTGHA